METRQGRPGQQQHVGWRYQPLSDCPAQGTITYILNWAAPTRVEPKGELPHGQVQQLVVLDGGDAGVSILPAAPQLRRSSRAGRGQTKKFDDYVHCVSYRNRYEQEWLALGGGRRNW